MTDLSVALPPWSLANAVTSFALIAAGVFTLAQTRLTRTQPGHWQVVYACILLVGLATLGLHGFGEPRGGAWGRIGVVADTGSNLALALAVLLATLRDFETPARGRRAGRFFLLLNLAAFIHVGMEKFLGGTPGELRLGSFGGLSLSQLAIVLDYLGIVAIFVRARASLPVVSRRLLPLLTLSGLLGLALAMPVGERVDASFIAWHALWHVVGAFTLMTLWTLNELRFTEGACGAAAAGRS